MKARLIAVSLAALACADAAAAQEAAAIQPGSVGAILNEAPGAQLALPSASLANDGASPPAAPDPVPTDIRADRNNPLALGTQVTQVGRNHVIDGGTRAGNNLFHSFSRFDLGQGDFARWVHSAGDPASIKNVVNRVTGGDPSRIFGTLDSSALPNADFYFINPAGIVFGEGARINVPAAAHFSTAQQLGFDTGPAFTVATPGGSTFSVANPAAFGFVGGQGDVAMRGIDNVPFTGSRLTLTGRDVTVADTVMGADAFGIAAVGSGTAQLAVNAPRALGGDGRVEITGAVLRSRADDGILVSGSAIDIAFSTLGTAFTPGPRSGIGGPIDIFGRDVSIFASLVSASTSGAEPAGEIRIAGTNVTVSGGSMIQSETQRGSTGTAGGISVRAADTLIVEDRSRISSSTLSAQDGGSISLDADRILIDQSGVASQAQLDSSGRAGNIRVTGGALLMQDGSGLSSASNGTGNGGFVSIAMRDSVHMSRSGLISEARGSSGRSGIVSVNAPLVVLDDGSSISTSTSTAGEAGIVGIIADDLRLLGGSVVESLSTPFAEGNAGFVMILRPDVDGGRLFMSGDSAIRSDTNGPGNAGGVRIMMDEILLRNGSRITSDVGRGCIVDGCGPLGAAGDIRIDGVNLSLAVDEGYDGAATAISSDTFGGGGGLIDISLSGDLSVGSRTSISSDTMGDGRGGQVDIRARNILVSGGLASITAMTFGRGAGGSIRLDALGTIRVEEEGFVSTQSGDRRTGLFSPPDQGASGDISLFAPSIVLTGGGFVTAGTFTDGAAGNIFVRADRLVMDDFSRLSSAAFGPGTGGTVRIVAGELAMGGGASIETDSQFSCFGEDCRAGGAAGDIDIVAGRIALIGRIGAFGGEERPSISSDTETPGAAGQIRIKTDELLLDAADIASRTSQQGNAGSVDIVTDRLVLRNRAMISTSSTCTDCAQPGNGGDIKILAPQSASLDGVSEIASDTEGSGAAGSVEIRAGALAVRGGSIISSETRGSGDAGSILIAADLFELIGFENTSGTNYSTISSATFGRGNAGSITIAADRLRLESGRIRSNTLGRGNAGTVTLTGGEISFAAESQVLSDSRPSEPLCFGACFESNAGSIDVIATRSLAISGESLVASTTGTRGAAGSVSLSAPLVTIDNATVSSSSVNDGTGPSGKVGLIADVLRLTGRASIETVSNNSNRAGDIGIIANDISLEGPLARIASSNESRDPAAAPDANAAGTVLIARPTFLTLLDGAQITTSSLLGPAGDILISMPGDGLLTLQSADPRQPSLITTSSGPGTGGQIAIARPRALISNGGSILALGQQGGANVQLDAQYLISSSDRLNRIEVSGNFLLEAAAYDVSAGTVNRDLSVIDASGVLRGQCAAVRQTGQVSQLVVRPIGPYGARPTSARPDRSRLLTAAELQESCS